MPAELIVIGADHLAVSFGSLALNAIPRTTKVLAHFGQLYQTRVRAHASGRPGPRVITGDYRRSITFEMAMVGGQPAAIIGTAAPQGRRLELGFTGVDSLGRHYSAPPFPHFDPPLEPTMAELDVALAAAILDERNL